MAIPKFDAGSYIIPNSRTIVLFTFLWLLARSTIILKIWQVHEKAKNYLIRIRIYHFLIRMLEMQLIMPNVVHDHNMYTHTYPT